MIKHVEKNLSKAEKFKHTRMNMGGYSLNYHGRRKHQLHKHRVKVQRPKT